MIHRLSIFRCVFLILFVSHVPWVASAADEKPVEFYLQGVKAARSELKSGKFICTGTRTIREVRIKPTGLEFGKPTSEIPIYFRCSFDGDSLQFDYGQDGKPNERKVLTQVFDPRFSGALGLEEMEIGKDIDWFVNTLQSAKLTSITSEKGLSKITWIGVNNRRPVERMRTIYVDAAHGFTPVRLELRIRPLNNTIDWSTLPVVSRSEVVWKLKSRVWVPVEVHYEMQYGVEIVIHKLDWKEINKTFLD